MVLVYILALDMGLVTKDQIHPKEHERVYEALENIGRLDLWED